MEQLLKMLGQISFPYTSVRICLQNRDICTSSHKGRGQMPYESIPTLLLSNANRAQAVYYLGNAVWEGAFTTKSYKFEGRIHPLFHRKTQQDN